MASSTAAIDEIINNLQDAKGLIVDVRRNGGGDDKVDKAVADRFADKKHLFMITRSNNGSRHNDFPEAKNWFVEPDGETQYTNPTVLLKELYTIRVSEDANAWASKAVRYWIESEQRADNEAGTDGETLILGEQR